MNWIIWTREEVKVKKRTWSKEWIYSMIAYYYGVQVSQIQIQRTKWNKPFLEIKDGKQACFNYSHTKNYLLIGFSEYTEVGVDVEEINSGHKSIDLIIDCLATEEREYIKTLDNNQQREALLKIWVQKEAIGKALGIGLLYDTSSMVVKYELVTRESFDITFCNREISVLVWREDEFWACVAYIRSIEQEMVSGGKGK